MHTSLYPYAQAHKQQQTQTKKRPKQEGGDHVPPCWPASPRDYLPQAQRRETGPCVTEVLH